MFSEVCRVLQGCHEDLAVWEVVWASLGSEEKARPSVMQNPDLLERARETEMIVPNFSKTCVQVSVRAGLRSQKARDLWLQARNSLRFMWLVFISLYNQAPRQESH